MPTAMMTAVGHREHTAAGDAKGAFAPRLFFEGLGKREADFAQPLQRGIRIVIVSRMGHVFAQARTPSMILRRAGVGIILVSLNAAAARSERNSASERCRPPVQTSMLTSLAAAPRAASEVSTRS